MRISWPAVTAIGVVGLGAVIATCVSVWSAPEDHAVFQVAAPTRQPSDVRAVHRAGQTFITWREVDPPRVDQTSVDVVLRRKRELVKTTTYRVYRSTRPGPDLSTWQFVGDTGPLSAWNAEIAGFVDPPATSQAFRYRISDNSEPLPEGTGLYVHNPAGAGQAFYAVTLAVNGSENRALTDANRTTAGLQETVGQGVPVLQRVDKPDSFAYVEKPQALQLYTRWEAPPNANQENRPIDYLVAVPRNVGSPAAVGIHMHAYGASLYNGWGWWFNGEQGAILVSSNEIPYDWWTGYHELTGKIPLDSPEAWRKGIVRPYTQTRLLSFVSWLATTRPIDLPRTFTAGNSMGGSGSVMLAIRQPDRVAWAASWVGVHRPHLTPTFRGSYALSYGPPEAGVKFEDGTPVWEYFDDAVYLRRHPERGVGLLIFANGRNDNDIGWQQAVDFVRALQETRQPHLFVWGQEGHGQRTAMPANGDERTMPLDLRTDRSLPAFTRGSLDDDPGDGTAATGAKAGQINYYFLWDTNNIVDTVDRWEMTVGLASNAPRRTASADVTPRRTQAFKPAAGTRVRWTNSAGGGGEVVVDKNGLVTIPQATITSGKNRLTLERVQ